MHRSMLLLLAPLLVAAPASAQTFEEWKSGNWTVYAYEGECWLVSRDGVDTQLSIGVSHSDPDFYVSAGKPGWSSATPSMTYSVRLRFGSIDRTSDGAGLQGRVRGVGVISTATAVTDLAELTTSKTLTLFYANDSYSVALDRTAITQLNACVVAIGGIGAS